MACNETKRFSAHLSSQYRDTNFQRKSLLDNKVTKQNTTRLCTQVSGEMRMAVHTNLKQIIISSLRTMWSHYSDQSITKQIKLVSPATTCVHGEMRGCAN